MASALDQLKELGYPEELCVKALKTNGHTNLNKVALWLMSNESSVLENPCQQEIEEDDISSIAGSEFSLIELDEASLKGVNKGTKSSECIYEGVIKHVNEEKKYGFIKPVDAVKKELQLSKDVFFPFRSFRGDISLLGKGARIVFSLKQKENGKPEAAKVMFAGESEGFPSVAGEDDISSIAGSEFSLSEFDGASVKGVNKATRSSKCTCQGVIKHLNEEKKYGFIRPVDAVKTELQIAKDVFFPFRSFCGDISSLGTGVHVVFSLKQKKNGKTEAAKVILAGESKEFASVAGLLKVDDLQSIGGEVASNEKEKNITTNGGKQNDIATNNCKENDIATGSKGTSGLPAGTSTSRSFKNTWSEGRISFWGGDHGYISVREDASKKKKETGESSNDKKGKNGIFCHKDKFPVGALDPVRGDRVEFVVGTTKSGRESVFRLRISKYYPRSPDVLKEYLENLRQTLLTEGLSASHILQLVPIFAAIGETEELGIDSICLFLEVQCQLMESRNGGKSVTLEWIRKVCTSSLFAHKTGSFVKLIKKSLVREDLLKKYILGIVKQSAEFCAFLLPIIKAAVDTRFIQDINFMYDVLKEVSFTSNVECFRNISWDQLPLVPAQSEMERNPIDDLSSTKCISVTSSFADVEEYMDTYFRLYRAECFTPICEGVKHLLNGTLDPRDMNVYLNVRLGGYEILPSEGILLCLQFKPLIPVKNWETSTLLKFGSLLCVSVSGSFKDVIWVTVCKKDTELLKTRSMVTVSLCSEVNSLSTSDIILKLYRSGGHAIMVESPSYYAATSPVLQALHGMAGQDLPFEDEIVFNHQNAFPPAWLPSGTNVAAYVSTVANLDRSQSSALEKALSHRLAIVQGPPGTGKTYIGVKIVSSVIHLRTEPSRPILVLTYKNHALDEFLKHLLPLDMKNKIVRIGGRSSEAELEERNLNHLMKNQKTSKGLFDAMREIREEMIVIKDRIVECFNNLDSATYLTAKTLFTRLTKEQIINLLTNSDNMLSKRTKNIYTPMLEEYLTKGMFEDVAKELKFFNFFAEVLRQWMPSKDEMMLFRSRQNRRFRLSSASTTSKRKFVETTEEDFNDEVDRDEVENERIAALGKSTTSGKKGLATILDSVKEKEEDVVIRLTEDYCGPAATEIIDLHSLNKFERFEFLNLLMAQGCELNTEDLCDSVRRYLELSQLLKELQNQQKLEILRDNVVVGMTITGACIHRNLISTLQPQIVIVEEAAEILEPQLMACLGTWVDHLILIGDHKQLRPNVDTYVLKKDYKLDVSMMERLISRGILHTSLQIQNRMRPEIAQHLKDIYPDLQNNNEVVYKHEIPRCLQTPIFFWSHDATEESERSFRNVKEADMVIALLLLFLSEGYRPSQITVLAAYLGQVGLLRKKVKEAESKYPELFSTVAKPTGDEAAKPSRAPINVHTIDMYQGDENDIVIISLVRSNSMGRTGFLNFLNRRCVAQSRARCGVYFVGNVETISTSQYWSGMLKEFEISGKLGKTMKVFCSRHPSSATDVWSEESLLKVVTRGFCLHQCKTIFSCGQHKCKKICAPRHRHGDCQEIVPFVSKCGHSNCKKCFEDAERIKCHQTVIAKLDCGHSQPKQCYEKLYEIKCQTVVTHEFPSCKHTVSLKCDDLKEGMYCKKKCPRMLRCGHPCEQLCGIPCNHDSCRQCAKIKEMQEKAREEKERQARDLARTKAKEEIKKLEKAIQKNDSIIKIDPLSPLDEEYINVDDQVRKYIQTGHNWVPNVTAIYKVINLDLQRKWYEAKLDMFNPDYSARKFHGTTDDGVKGITKEGFRLPTSPGMYGAGIYFATDSSKSAQEIYTRGSCKLLLCDVLLGKTHRVENAKPNMTREKLRKLGCDSIFAPRNTKGSGGVLYDEYVVFNPNQALPKYIIHWNRNSSSSANMKALGQPSSQTSSVKRYTLKESRFVKPDDPHQFHYRLAESQFFRLKANSTHYQNRCISKIEYVENTKLESKFEAKKQQFEMKYGRNKEESQIIFAFHGTNSSVIDKIMEENFRLDKIQRTAHGHGIYLSEFPDVSLGYSSGERALILCKLLTGKSAPHDMSNYIHQSYDSNRVQPDSEGHSAMWVIPDPDQILPCYVIYLK